MNVNVQAIALGAVLAVIGVGTASVWLTVSGVVLACGVILHKVLQDL